MGLPFRSHEEISFHASGSLFLLLFQEAPFARLLKKELTGFLLAQIGKVCRSWQAAGKHQRKHE
jgi:hypothetical protein